MDRKNTWNERYQKKSSQLLEPEPFLVDHISHFMPGSLLDMASGDGRNSIFLAQKGFDVTGLDFSKNALDRLRTTADEKKLIIKTLELDLNFNDGLFNLEKFDNVIAIHYKLSDLLLDHIPELLNPGGLFLYYTFNRKQAKTNSFPETFCLEEAALVDKKWKLELLKYASTEDYRGFKDGYLFRR